MQPRIGGLLLDDVHGAGWRLVTVDDDLDGLDPGTVEWFESIGGQVVALGQTDPVANCWFAERTVTWALQRPDFYLYGTAADAPQHPPFSPTCIRSSPPTTTCKEPPHETG